MPAVYFRDGGSQHVDVEYQINHIRNALLAAEKQQARCML